MDDDGKYWPRNNWPCASVFRCLSVCLSGCRSDGLIFSEKEQTFAFRRLSMFADDGNVGSD